MLLAAVKYGLNHIIYVATNNRMEQIKKGEIFSRDRQGI